MFGMAVFVLLGEGFLHGVHRLEPSRLRRTDQKERFEETKKTAVYRKREREKKKIQGTIFIFSTRKKHAEFTPPANHPHPPA